MAEETVHRGLGVSVGVAYGPAYLVTPSIPRVPSEPVDATAVDREIDRFEAALDRSRDDIRRVQRALLAADNGDEAAIFDAHLLILEDELLERTRARIREEHANAAFAFHAQVLEAIDHLERSENAYLRERAKDIRDVEHRVIRHLLGEREPAVGDLMQNAILIAHDLPPTLTAELDRDRILGFATEIGATLSHTAILARALEIPAVIDLGPILPRLTHGEPVILDGREGLVITHPREETIAEYERIRAKIARKRAEWVSLANAPSVTADGTPLTFLANLEFTREVDSALAFGCEGVGLYRTEYLFLQSGGEPSEEEQYAVYRELVERMDGRPVTIRTIDLGGDKLLAGMEAEENPFLGWRAIRYSLDRPESFRTQLRAILRAGAYGPVAIMFPMISTLEEADQAVEHLAAARRSLTHSDLPHAESCPVGVLVETPAAALVADDLARRFDFLALGTNDLIQYTLAVDRGNRRIAHLFQPFHPAVLRLLCEVIEAARKLDRDVTVCGEMASNSRAATLLLGLGIRRFSMVPARIPRIKQVLARIDLGEATEAAVAARAAPTATAVADIVNEWFGDRFKQVSRPAAEE